MGEGERVLCLMAAVVPSSLDWTPAPRTASVSSLPQTEMAQTDSLHLNHKQPLHHQDQVLCVGSWSFELSLLPMCQVPLEAVWWVQ